MSTNENAFGDGYKAGIRDFKEKIDALQAFKDFIHGRLDKMGIPTHPDGVHSKAGCRIGDRLDLVEAQLKKLAEVDYFSQLNKHPQVITYYQPTEEIQALRAELAEAKALIEILQDPFKQ